MPSEVRRPTVSLPGDPSRRSRRELDARSAFWILLLFVGASAAFAGISALIEVASGHPLISGNLPGTTHSAEDALWHLATGFLLVLPARRRVLLWLGPLLGLGIDADHLFGGLLPTVVFRESHSFLFLLVVVGVLYYYAGVMGAGLGAGGFLVHLSVDGGLFPLLGPVTVSAFPLPFAVQILGVGLSASCSFLAVNSLAELRRPSRLLVLGAAIALLSLVLAFAPELASFNGA